MKPCVRDEIQTFGPDNWREPSGTRRPRRSDGHGGVVQLFVLRCVSLQKCFALKCPEGAFVGLLSAFGRRDASAKFGL